MPQRLVKITLLRCFRKFNKTTINEIKAILDYHYAEKKVLFTTKSNLTRILHITFLEYKRTYRVRENIFKFRLEFLIFKCTGLDKSTL